MDVELKGLKVWLRRSFGIKNGMSYSKLLFGMINNKNTPLFCFNSFPVNSKTHVSNIFIIAVIYLLKNILSVLCTKVDLSKRSVLKKKK